MSMCLVVGLAHETAAAGDTQDRPPSLDALIESIEQAENSLVNLKIESTFVSEEYDQELDVWVPTPVRLSATTWLDGNPQGRMRMDIHEETLRWRNGPADYSSDSLSFGFDGEKGKIARHLTGAMGEQFQVRRGEVTESRPAALDDPWRRSAAGAGLSLHFFSDFRREQRRFSEYLREIAGYGQVKLEVDTFRGVPCIRVLNGELDGWHEVYYLDPARGYAMLGRRFINRRADGSQICLQCDTITELKRAALGIWYPVEAYRDRVDDWPDGQVTRRQHYVVSDVVANDPVFDEDIFNLTFPAKYYVTDKRHGITYLTSGDPNDVSAQLDQMVDFIKQSTRQ